MTQKIETIRGMRIGNTKQSASSKKGISKGKSKKNRDILKIVETEETKDEVCEEFKTSTEIKKPKQPIQLKHWFFTFNNYSKGDIGILEKKFKAICVKYVFQEETGESGTPHLQGSIHLIYAMRPSEFKLNNKIHWEKTNNETKADEYCEKIDSRTGDVFKWGFPPPKVPIEYITELYEWQQEIYNLCLPKPNPRDIVWVYDKSGNNGKTEFCKYMYDKIDAVLSDDATKKDIACLIADMVEDDDRDFGKQTTFLFDFPRSCKSVDYGALESVKNGLIMSPKFHSKTLIFNKPHVIVMSNSLPEFSKMSIDRWIVYELNDKKLHKMDIKKYLKNICEDDNMFIEDEE
ncbi:replication-associated protein [Crucivirus-112]|nr:replication-associated protein [Crucivirus-112]